MSKTYVYNEKLKYARELRGWSQEELARRVSCLADGMGHRGVVLDVSTISRWERGRNTPSPFYRQLLCSLFEMNAAELGLLPSGSLPHPGAEMFSAQQSGLPTVPVCMPDALPQADAEKLSFQADGLPLLPFHASVTLPQYIDDDVSVHGFGAPMMIFQERDFPYAGVYDDTLLETGERDQTSQNCAGEQVPVSASPPPFLVVHRRKFLLALLAGAMLGGVAVVLEQFQSHQQSRPPASAALTRSWPEVVPDSHKRIARVRVIQWMLNVRGWNIPIDGIFWVRTENAVMYFQEDTNLPVNTTVSSPTWERLIVVSRMADQELTYQGGEVKALQEMLNLYNVVSPRLQVDGSFGPLTEAATRRFQQMHHLTVTGQADLNTWCLLVGGKLQ